MKTAEEKTATKEKKSPSKKEGDLNVSIEEMTKAGLHLGNRTSAVNPKMKPYIFGVRNGFHIIDAEKTAEKLKEALDFVQDLVSQNGVLLFVGTKIQIKDTVKEIAIVCSMPYISERWLGGTFTNFATLQKRMEYFKTLEKNKVEGGLAKYTKKEIAKFEKEIHDLETKFGGLKEMTKIPEAIFVCDATKNNLAIKEANKKGVKVIAIANTNTDPTLIDYVIPANDDAISSVKYILEKVKEAILRNKSETPNPKS